MNSIQLRRNILYRESEAEALTRVLGFPIIR